MDGSRFLLSTGRAANQQGSIAQAAKEAREARSRARQHEASLLTAQRAVRRWLGRTRARKELVEDLDRKLRDVAALQTIVEKKTRSAFCPPLPASLRLVRQFLFCHRSSEGGNASTPDEAEAVRVSRLCACILLPHFSQTPSALVSALAADPHTGRLLIRRLLDLLLSYAAAIDYSATGADPSSSLVVVLPTIGRLCTTGRLVLPDWPAKVWPALRAICLRYEAAFFTPSKRGASSTWLAGPAFQALFQLVQTLLLPAMASDGNGGDGGGNGVKGYNTNLLTIPTFAAHVPDHSAVLSQLLEAWGALAPAANDALPPSPSPAASSLVWLLSNAATILHAALLLAPPDPSSSSANVRALLLEGGGLASITGLLAEAPPGIVSEGMISVVTKGAASVTHCVDAQVTAAARLLFHEEFVRRLAGTTLLRANAEEEVAGPLKALERPEDRRAVSRTAAALDLTFAAHEAHRAQREAPLLSRVTRRVSSFFGGLGWGGRNAQEEREEEEEEEVGSDDGGEGVVADEQPERREEESLVSMAVPVLGLEPLVDFLATALWKCHAAEASTHSGAKGAAASSLLNPTKRAILSTLAFPQNGAAIARLWLQVLTRHAADMQRNHKLRLADYATPSDCGSARGFLSTLALLAALLQHQLLVLTDEELCNGLPLPIPHLIRLIGLLERLIFHGCVSFAAQMDRDEQRHQTSATAGTFGHFLLNAFCQLLRRLFDRWSRRAFCVAEVWSMQEGERRRAQRAIREKGGLGTLLLQAMPFALPFPERLDRFRAWARAEKRTFQSPDMPPIFVKIRRNYLVEDALGMLQKLQGVSLKRRVIIVFTSHTGAQEAGVDSGGLLREFVAEVCARAFSTDFGLFTRTPESGLLYPSPASQQAHPGSEHLRLFELLGTLLGKAVFEGITVEALFAPFFLGALRGRQQFFHVLDDLRQLDEEMHRNLTYVRRCQDAEEVAALGLTFTVARDAFGEREEVELVAKGKDMAVTADNKFLYIQLVSKHYTVDRIASQTQAFVRGFHSVVPATVLQAFSEPELQILLTGSLAGVDVADMRRHAQYAGGYTSLDRHVRRLWDVLGGFSQEELALFLHFVTSSRRAPTGGFGTLQPPLTIVRVPIRRDDEKLPVGRTCFNQLLWPTYKSTRVAREKLLFAISAQAGFELT